MRVRPLRLAIQAALVGIGLLAATSAGAFERQAFTNAALSWAREQPSYIVFIHADWCTTCQAQDRALERLAADPRFANLRIVVVDYDTQTHIMRYFNAPERSTFIVFHGETEVARAIAITDVAEVEQFLLAATPAP
jgi:thiol-disulfide isomerase/thioredoxin